MDFWILKTQFDKLSKNLLKELEPNAVKLSHKEWLKQYNKAYYQKNKEKIKLKSKIYHQKNKPQKQQNKVYYQSTGDKQKWTENELMLLCRLYKQNNNITSNQIKIYFDRNENSLNFELKRLQYLHTEGEKGLLRASKLLTECYNLIN